FISACSASAVRSRSSCLVAGTPAATTTSATSGSSASTSTARSGTRSPSAARRTASPRSVRSSVPRYRRAKSQRPSSESSSCIARCVPRASASSTRYAAWALRPSRRAPMRRILRRREIVADDWVHLGEEAADGAALIVPLVELRKDPGRWWEWSGRLGVRLTPVDRVEELAQELPRLDLVAVEFPNPSDGRGYSQAGL